MTHQRSNVANILHSSPNCVGSSISSIRTGGWQRRGNSWSFNAIFIDTARRNGDWVRMRSVTNRGEYAGPGPQFVSFSTGNVWCSRDCLGRLVGLFLSWADASAAEHYHNVMIAFQDVSEEKRILLIEAVITLVASDGRLHQLKAHAAYDRDSDYLTEGAFIESQDALDALANRVPNL